MEIKYFFIMHKIFSNNILWYNMLLFFEIEILI